MKPTNASVLELLDELKRRMLAAEDAADRPGSIAHFRTLVGEAYEAGRSAGISGRAGEGAQALRHLLDEATERMPGTMPDGIASTDPGVAYWRTGRQHLWELVEAERASLETQSDIVTRRATLQAQRLEQRMRIALQPAPSLRQRVGQWLYALGVRISERGAA